MANNMVQGETVSGYVDKRRNARAGTSATQSGTPGSYNSIATLRARLTAISATSYSAARLDTMTENDMLYAVRLNDDLTGV